MFQSYLSSFAAFLSSPEFSALFAQIYSLVSAPLSNSDLLWAVYPLIITTVVVELYFGAHKEERLGWNSATANGLVLVWVGVSTIRTLMNSGGFDLNLLTSQVAGAIVGLGALLVFVSFFHILPKDIAFFVSSAIVVHFLAYLGLIFVYTDIVFNGITFYAAFLIFIVLVVFFSLVKKLEPDLY
ncbi:MAG: hypothetical protein KAJ20_02165 [Candidatus Aenigmarchaeota archaeon]|nr:hypothetical protein [Candidatus Aenigmarchaeota archaeon]MCK5373116.1 hypothetical protein [Candidatus Aenigmarchaeota archaeon]